MCGINANLSTHKAELSTQISILRGTNEHFPHTKILICVKKMLICASHVLINVHKMLISAFKIQFFAQILVR